MQVNRLLARLIQEQHAVEMLGRVAADRTRLDARESHVPGQFKRRHILGIVDTAHDERSIRISFLEGNHNLIPDPRPEKRPVAIAGPRLRHAHPAGAVRIVLAVAVPVKLHLDPAEWIDKRLGAGGPTYHRRLRAVDARSTRRAPRAIRQPFRQARERVRITRHHPGVRHHGLTGPMLDTRQQVGAFAARVFFEAEERARREVGHVAGSFHLEAAARLPPASAAAPRGPCRWRAFRGCRAELPRRRRRRRSDERSRPGSRRPRASRCRRFHGRG